MRTLALETSTRRGGAALFEDGRLLSEVVTDRQRSHSELIHVFVDECLQKAKLQLSDIDVFATDRGPGSFTGIRVAANVAKTFAYAFQKPLVSLDSLTIIAAAAPARSVPVLVMLNAFKNMVYYGVFKTNENALPDVVIPPTAATIPEIIPHIQEPMMVLGDGYELFLSDLEPISNFLEVPSEPILYPSPSTLARLAEIEAKNGRVLAWNEFVPLYLRASEAEEKLRGSLFKPVNAKDRVDGTSR